MNKIAFDLRGVIVDKITGLISDECIMSIKLTVEKLKKENVYIISKAKDKWININKERLKNIDFFKRTGMLNKNLYFVNEYEDKEKLCKKLNINYMVDDSIKVIRCLSCNSFLFGVNNVDKRINLSNNICIASWKKFRKKLNKI